MSASESARARHQMASTIQAGERVLSEKQTIAFTKYVRLALPIDGSVFWVRADLASPSALFNAHRFNAVSYNAVPDQIYSAPVVVAHGSLHYMSQAVQEEGDSAALNRVLFTSEEEIKDFSDISPTVMYIGDWQDIRFSFAQRGMYYEQAKIHHYEGNAILSTMETQIIDDLLSFSPDQVVSNSLPIWLDLMNPYIPMLGLGGLPWPILPSFLVPADLPPPFVSVHVFPESTQAISSAPIINRTQSRSQLVREKVRLTTYGLRNAAVLDLCDYVQWQFQNSAKLGIMNMPVPRDEKQPQIEMGVLAQKKTIEYEVNYLQATARDMARQMILSAFVAYIPQAGVTPDPGTARWNEFFWNEATWSIPQAGVTPDSGTARWNEFFWNSEATWS